MSAWDGIKACFYFAGAVYTCDGYGFTSTALVAPTDFISPALLGFENHLVENMKALDRQPEDIHKMRLITQYRHQANVKSHYVV